MNKKILILVAAMVLLGAIYMAWPREPVGVNNNGVNMRVERGILKPEEEKSMKLASIAFGIQGEIPAKYSCDGDNINPPLQISEVPDETKSLVLIMEDPDVPKSIRSDGMWDHWVVFNMPPDTSEIIEGKEPDGVPGRGTSGEQGYSGPCPPDGEHRYFFKLFALDTRLDLAAGATKVEVEAAMDKHIIVRAELVGRYRRK